ncbi:STAS domain-containing protein [Amycolatopsis acidicola]|uniref:STAS domain-containing protein n=1 Tax=Amycolatopsis acidicola TaxID=2596893 RepID=A0A5N0UZW2_9PSEU|nr:STAS domain-containing protein [Amycolatopsis acidicola]KAA9158760.1 STAS domain-containing protein [Amycolatopsis acidicola]
MTAGRYTLHVRHGLPATVTAEGEVDATNASEFAAALDGIPGSVVLDLGGLRYLDSAGFAALDNLLAHRKMTVVLPPGSRLRKAAALMGLPHHDDVPSAAAQL